MRFDLKQTIGAPTDVVAAAYASAELYEQLGATSKLAAPEVLSRDETAGRVALRIHYQFIAELSPAVTAVVDRARLSWVEESHHDLAARTVEVVLHPDHYPDRLRCSGTYRYDEQPGPATVRIISGSLSVRALLVAGTVERAIVSGLAEHLVEEAAAVEAYLSA